MKRLLFSLTFLLFYVSLNAQIAPDRYWVQFTDKNNSPYSIDKPEDFLSDRAIERRNNYGISIDEKDIPVNPEYIEKVAATGAVILNPSKWLNGVTVEVPASFVLSEIKKLPFVKKTRHLQDEPLKHMLKENSRRNEVATYSKNYTDYRNYYGKSYVQINQLNGIALHESGYQGQGMWIGICDSGFEGADTHKVFNKLREDGRLLGTRDFVYKNGIVYSDDHHGTSCLSLMAGYVPNEFMGTAPLASYFLCRTENVNSESVLEEYNWVSAAELLDSIGVDVISTSLGYISFDDDSQTHDYSDLDGETCIITKGAEIACSRGILCINAAGNEGDNPFPYIGAPADAKSVLTVGAVKSNGERTYFSSIGPTYDGRIKPDVMAYGYNVTVASPTYYYEGNGTSFACPILAGMATCLWQADKEKSAADIREILKQSANNYSNPNNEYGCGIPDFSLAFESLNLKKNEEFDVNVIVSLCPNPSNDKVVLDVKSDGIIKIQVFNLLGENVYSGDFHNDSVEYINSYLTNLGKGVYFIKLKDDNKNQVVKLIKY